MSARYAYGSPAVPAVATSTTAPVVAAMSADMLEDVHLTPHTAQRTTQAAESQAPAPALVAAAADAAAAAAVAETEGEADETSESAPHAQAGTLGFPDVPPDAGDA